MTSTVEHVVVGVEMKDWRRFEQAMAAVGFRAHQVDGGSHHRGRYVAVRTSQKSKVPGDLSPQEMRVLALVAEGRTNDAIAIDLNVSVEAVKKVVRRMLAKLGADNRWHAVALGFTAGLLPLPGERDDH